MKVAIIGAGINGLYIAKKLSELKNEVIVFEKKSKIENIVCSGLFSKRLLEFIPEAEKLIEKRIKSVKINFPKKTIEVSFSKEFLIIDHLKLDELVFEMAQKSGATIVFNSNIKEIPEGFDLVIGCDGFDSVVRKSLKLPDLSIRLGIQGFADEKWNADYVEVWPQKSGFLWKIPRNEMIEYGIIASFFSASWLFKDFLKKKNILIKGIKSKAIPQGLILPEDDKIALCGDAAGLTKPWSGGGVVWGIIAANYLVRNFPDLRKYRKETASFFGKKIWFSKLAIKIVYFFGFNFPWLVPSKLKMESDFLF